MLLIAVVALSGCLGGDEVETVKKGEGYGLEIVEFVTGQAEVIANRITTIQMTVENKGDHTIDSNLGLVYLILNDRGAALNEYKILKDLDPEKANELFNLIYK